MNSRLRGAALLLALFGAALVSGGARRVDATAGVSEVVEGWKASPTSDEKLEEELVALGADAAPDLAKLVTERAAETEAGDGPPIAPLARALARVAGEASVASLERLSRSERGSDRAAAVAALAAVPTKESLDLVVAALNGDSPEAAEAAVETLPKIVTAAPDHLSVRRLILALRESPRADLAARVLGRLHTPESHDHLLEMLSRPDANVQSAALDGLWDCGTLEDCEAVRPFLATSKEMALRKSACLLLGHLHDRESVGELIDLLADADEGLAADAHWALCEITLMRLGPDKELWSAWWDGGGSQQYGAAGGGSSTSGGSFSSTASMAPASVAKPSPRTADLSGNSAGSGLTATLIGVTVVAGAAAAIVMRRRKLSAAATPVALHLHDDDHPYSMKHRLHHVDSAKAVWRAR